MANRDERARKTLYVTGFDPKWTTKQLLKELFNQGGPVADVTLLDTHAYILFHHEESVPYCLALFNEVELYGHKLRLNPRFKVKNNFVYMNYLADVRQKLREKYMKMDPPKLPPKIFTESTKKSHADKRNPSLGKKKAMKSVRTEIKLKKTAIPTTKIIKASKARRGRRKIQKSNKFSV